jgi:hypothetical protein
LVLRSQARAFPYFTRNRVVFQEVRRYYFAPRRLLRRRAAVRSVNRRPLKKKSLERLRSRLKQ